jgi:hypothetical protein
MVNAWIVFYLHAWSGKLLSPRLLRAISAEIPAELGLIMGLTAIFENMYPPDPANRMNWIIGFAVISLFTVGSMVALRMREDKRSDTDKEAQQSRDVLAAEQYKVTLRVEEKISVILASNNTDAEKVENIIPYVTSLKAFALVDEISRYLENNKLVHPPRLGPVMRALRGPISWDQTPEAMMADAFKETFADRLKALVLQFKEIGIDLPQRDEAYFNPGMYRQVPLAVSQIKDAANQLVASLSGSLEVKTLGFLAQPTVKKPEQQK